MPFDPGKFSEMPKWWNLSSIPVTIHGNRAALDRERAL